MYANVEDNQYCQYKFWVGGNYNELHVDPCITHWDYYYYSCLKAHLGIAHFSLGLMYLNIPNISWSRRVSLLTSLKLSGLEKSQSQHLLFFESCRFNINVSYKLSVLFYFHLIKSWIKMKLMIDFHCRPLIRPWIITNYSHPVSVSVSVSTLRPIFLVSVSVSSLRL